MRRLPQIASAGLALLAAVPLAAQRPAAAGRAPAVPAEHPKVRQALASLKATNDWTLEQQASICEVPAPPFKEAARAAEYKRRLEALGLVNVRIERENVRVYVPIVSMLLVSVALSLLLWIVRRFL